MESTKYYLKIIIQTPLNEQRELRVPYGEGLRLMQRCRTELSRIRQRLKMRGSRIQQFSLRADVRAEDKVDVVRYIRISADAPFVAEPTELETLLTAIETSATGQ